jgi:hypothetical protein
VENLSGELLLAWIAEKGRRVEKDAGRDAAGTLVTSELDEGGICGDERDRLDIDASQGKGADDNHRPDPSASEQPDSDSAMHTVLITHPRLNPHSMSTTSHCAHSL